MFLCKKGLPAALAIYLSYICGLGCVSIVERPSLLIGNATEYPVREAVLLSGDERFDFGSIDGLAVSVPLSRIVELQESVVVQWLGSDGQKNGQVVRLGDALRSYAGHMQFEINGSNSVKVFTAPPKVSGDSELPWSMPANWEGSPTLPGMN